MRPIRFLLIRGADKTILNKENKSPIDLCDTAINNQFLRRDAKKMLGPPSIFDCLMLTPPTRLVKKNPKTLMVFLSIFAFTLLLEFFVTFRYLTWKQIGPNIGLVVLCLTALFFSVCTDAGRIKRQTVSFMHLLEVVEPT